MITNNLQIKFTISRSSLNLKKQWLYSFYLLLCLKLVLCSKLLSNFISTLMSHSTFKSHIFSICYFSQSRMGLRYNNHHKGSFISFIHRHTIYPALTMFPYLFSHTIIIIYITEKTLSQILLAKHVGERNPWKSKPVIIHKHNWIQYFLQKYAAPYLFLMTRKREI